MTECTLVALRTLALGPERARLGANQAAVDTTKVLRNVLVFAIATATFVAAVIVISVSAAAVAVVVVVVVAGAAIIITVIATLPLTVTVLFGAAATVHLAFLAGLMATITLAMALCGLTKVLLIGILHVLRLVLPTSCQLHHFKKVLGALRVG